jgi:hypothetical protein
MLDVHVREVLAKKRAELTVLPADDTRNWPAELLRSMHARQQRGRAEAPRAQVSL